MSSAPVPPQTSPAPWWRFGMVWLVLAGPAAVIVAGFLTLGLALQTPDTVLNTQAHPGAKAQAPAIQARNHSAATSGNIPK